MTEAEWLTSDDPAAMVAHVSGLPCNGEPDQAAFRRKLRLFACGCCRLVWAKLTDPRSRKAVEVAERFADGRATEEELAAARSAAADARNWMHESPKHYPQWLAHVCTCIDGSSVVAVTERQTELARLAPPAAQAGLLRCVFGNPWWPVALAADWLTWNGGAVRQLAQAAYDLRREGPCGRCKGEGKVWDNDQRLSLFESYRMVCPDCGGTGRAGDGLLDPDRLAVLADALEESGCTSADLLAHLRGKDPCWCRGKWKRPSGAPCKTCLDTETIPTGPHVRGCWAIDLLRGVQ